MKEYFPAPAYVLVVFGLLYLVVSGVAIDPDYFDGYRSWFLFSALPLTVFEALAYWQMREKNSDRKRSWAHVWLLILGYTIVILPFIFSYLSNALPLRHVRRIRYSRRSAELRYLVGVTLIVIAHVFFVIVRRKAAAQPSSTTTDSENLLDDINV